MPPPAASPPSRSAENKGRGGRGDAGMRGTRGTRGTRGMRKGKLLGRSFPLTLSRTFNRRIRAQSLSLDINKLQVVRIYPPSSVAVATASPRGEAFRKAFSVFYIKARGQKFDSCLSVFNCSLLPRLLSIFYSLSLCSHSVKQAFPPRRKPVGRFITRQVGRNLTLAFLFLIAPCNLDCFPIFYSLSLCSHSVKQASPWGEAVATATDEGG